MIENKYAIKLKDVKYRTSSTTYKPVFLAFNREGTMFTSKLAYAIRGNDKYHLQTYIEKLPEKYRDLFEVVEVEE